MAEKGIPAADLDGIDMTGNLTELDFFNGYRKLGVFTHKRTAQSINVIEVNGVAYGFNTLTSQAEQNVLEFLGHQTLGESPA